jgi:acyl-coenzyme A thioesterase PaaI-like protein
MAEAYSERVHWPRRSVMERREHEVLAFGIVAGESHLNPAGLVHGGMHGYHARSGAWHDVWEASERKPCVTIQFDTQFLLAVTSESFIEARGEVVTKTRGIIFMRGELTVARSTVPAGSAVLKVIHGPHVDAT